MLFAFPLLFIAFGQGLFWISSTLYQKRYFVATVLIALLIVLPAGHQIYKNITKPVRKEEMRPIVEYLKQNMEPNDRIYVYYGAKPAFNYYYRDNYKNVILGESHRDDITKYVPEINEILKDNTRLWLVFSHCWWERDEKGFFLNYVGEKSTLLDSFQATGASVYLYKIHTP